MLSDGIKNGLGKTVIFDKSSFSIPKGILKEFIPLLVDMYAKFLLMLNAISVISSGQERTI